MSGDSGDAGSSVSGGGNSLSTTSGWFFPDRIDLPFVTIRDRSGGLIARQTIPMPAYPPNSWTAEWFAWTALVDFVATAKWQDIQLAPWDPAATAAELDALVLAAQNERADALGEILAQASEFISYFANLMTVTPGGYPATMRVLNIANTIGLFMVMHFKASSPQTASGQLPQRPRPTHLRPALAPPIAVPGHASWPSGHSTQAHLMALCMTTVLEGNVREPVLSADCWALADRIARNREIAGVHYPSDTAAGVELAQKVHALLLGLPATSPFRVAVDKARAEWTV